MSKTLTIRFLVMAMIYFIVATIVGTLMLSGVVTPTKMLKAAHAHLALLGWMSATIIGAMYQQVPTLTATSLYSKRVGDASFLLFNAGVIGQFFAFIFLGYSNALTLASILLVSGILLFAYNIFMTLKDRKGSSQVIKFYSASVIYFVLAGILGLALVVSDLGGRIVFAHAHLALLGWVSLIIMGALSWMFPMVVMRDIQSPRLLDLVFWLFNIGTVGFFAGIVVQGLGVVTKIFALIVGLSVVLFAYLMLKTATKKMKMKIMAKATEGKFFKAAICYFVVAVVLGILMLFGEGGSIPGIKMLHVHIALIGFVSVTIFGGMYHIIPMLCWTRTVEKLAGTKGPMPSSFKDLYSDRLATIIFILLNVGVVGLFFGFILTLHPLAVVSAISINVAGVIFTFDMMRVVAKS